MEDRPAGAVAVRTRDGRPGADARPAGPDYSAHAAAASAPEGPPQRKRDRHTGFRRIQLVPAVGCGRARGEDSAVTLAWMHEPGRKVSGGPFRIVPAATFATSCSSHEWWAPEPSMELCTTGPRSTSMLDGQWTAARQHTDTSTGRIRRTAPSDGHDVVAGITPPTGTAHTPGTRQAYLDVRPVVITGCGPIWGTSKRRATVPERPPTSTIRAGARRPRPRRLGCDRHARESALPILRTWKLLEACDSPRPTSARVRSRRWGRSPSWWERCSPQGAAYRVEDRVSHDPSCTRPPSPARFGTSHTTTKPRWLALAVSAACDPRPARQAFPLE